jgi:hypothetical protein
MKKLSFLMVALISCLPTLRADSAPEASAQDTKKLVQNNFVETVQKGVKLSGYVDAGYSYNFTGQGGNSTVNSRVQSDSAQQGDFNLYAVKLALEKALTSENKAQAGFRVDVMIGEDAAYLANPGAGYNNTQQNSNYLFLEQAYVQLRAPVGNGWDFKVGKFASILGYEVMERPANMNITYGMLYNQFPFWYTGVLSSYKFDEYLDGKLGVANGANSDNNTTTSGGSDGVALLAGLNVTATGGNANWSHNFEYSSASENNTGSFPNASSGNTSQNALPVNVASTSSASGAWTIIYNSWGNWSPKFADNKLLLAFDSVLGNTAGANATNGGNTGANNTTWWGASAYAKYQFNDWFSLASRGEYFGGDNLNKINNTTGNSNPNAGLSWWEYTITAGFNVIDNVLIRAEYRLDWGDNISGTYTDSNAGAVNSSGPAHYAGAEVVYSF